jgi:hypothetical protein
MLAHPTLDQLNSLGLYGLAKGFKELEHKPEARSLDHAEWLGRLLEYELTLRRQKQFEHGLGSPSCVTPPASRTSTIKRHAASTARCSSNSRPVIGSPSVAICS